MLRGCLMLLVVLIGLGMGDTSADPGSAGRSADTAAAYKSPARFEKAIAAFEAADRKDPPAAGAIVCIGSSSMRGWHATIATDLAPLTIIPRGFGGSNMNDALHFIDRIVLPHKPRAVVVYEGDNDIAQGIEPETIRDTYRAFVAKLHARSPQVRVYFLSIKPSIRRWELWPRMVQANRLIAQECSNDERQTYVDVASGMLGDNGMPRAEIFRKDKLHMNAKGYVIWRDALRPVLIKSERRFEPPD